MPLLTWSNDLSVKIYSIDEQHKNLIALINNLYDAMGAGKGQAALGAILKELVDYTTTHFANEEKLMRAQAYPGYLAHKKEHDNLAAKVNTLQNDFSSGKPVMTVEVMRFLKDWLTSHIKGTDQKYSPFLIGKGVT